MHKMATAILTVLIITAFSTAVFAGVYTQKCATCHRTDGKKGVSKMSKDELLKKYKTTDEFTNGAKEATNPLMKSVQTNDKLLKDVAADLGLK